MATIARIGQDKHNLHDGMADYKSATINKKVHKVLQKLHGKILNE